MRYRELPRNIRWTRSVEHSEEFNRRLDRRRKESYILATHNLVLNSSPFPGPYRFLKLILILSASRVFTATGVLSEEARNAGK